MNLKVKKIWFGAILVLTKEEKIKGGCHTSPQESKNCFPLLCQEARKKKICVLGSWRKKGQHEFQLQRRLG